MANRAPSLVLAFILGVLAAASFSPAHAAAPEIDRALFERLVRAVEQQARATERTAEHCK